MNSSRGSSSSVVERLKLDFIVIGNQNAGKTSLIKSFALGDGTVSGMQARLLIHTLQPSA